MKIVWFSRHEPIKKQIDELKRLFGEGVEITQDPNPFRTADDVVRRFKENGGDEMMVVAPLSVLEQLCKRGIKPLYAEMELVQDGDYDVIANGRKFQFKKFVRITGIEIKKEEIV